MYLKSIPFTKILLAGILTFLMMSCQDDDSNSSADTCSGDLLAVKYDPSPYIVQIPEVYQQLPVPEDNPLTQEGVALGRKLFHDPIMSADSSQSCSSCHLSKGAFTDNLAVSKGIDGIEGSRSAMSLLDIGYVSSGLFWDGRVQTLEEQALIPVEDPVEMHHEWSKLIDQLREHSEYPNDFRRAFGIECKEEITKELAAKAIAQFERIIVSSGQSRYDLFLSGTINPTASEFRGMKMFFNHESRFSDNTLPDAECSHCHAPPLFFSRDFLNNGITEVDSTLNYPDLGRALVTGNQFDRGKFRVPSLRNVALSAPYMHDGSLKTLEEVVDHYNSGGHFSMTMDPLLGRPLNLTDEQKADIVSFLRMLTDTVSLNNPALQNPF